MVTGFLFDTCLVSETAKPSPDTNVEKWLRQLSADRFWTSVIVLGELQAGIALLSEGARRRSLTAWLGRQRAAFGDRCLGIDEPIARSWGELHATRRRTGLPLPVADGLIAATALVRGLAVATRNVADFRECGIQVVDPWSEREQK
jgi:predicted nucleic acid-binding protein